MKLRVFLSNTFDPWFNLATEDWLFRDLDADGQALFLWRNQPTVVIGRSQNPWVECHLENMERDHVLLARRQTGGGAVFHDLGNTNFTCLSGKTYYNKQANLEIIIRAIARFNIQAVASGRNDIVVNDSDHLPRKVSGSAFRETKDRAFQHGTLLIHTNLNQLQHYLNPNPKKLQAKGVSSVRARVANLSEYNSNISHEKLCDAIIEEFFNYYKAQCPIEFLNEDTLKTIAPINDYYEQLKNWEWRFGRTFEFNQQLEERFDWGTVDLRLNVNEGIIQNVQIFSDSLYPDFIDAIAVALQNCQYGKEEVQMALAGIKTDFLNLTSQLMQIQQWLKQQI